MSGLLDKQEVLRPTCDRAVFVFSGDKDAKVPSQEKALPVEYVHKLPTKSMFIPRGSWRHPSSPPDVPPQCLINSDGYSIKFTVHPRIFLGWLAFLNKALLDEAESGAYGDQRTGAATRMGLAAHLVSSCINSGFELPFVLERILVGRECTSESLMHRPVIMALLDSDCGLFGSDPHFSVHKPDIV